MIVCGSSGPSASCFSTCISSCLQATVCDILNEYLPSECQCTVPSPNGAHVSCSINFLDIDTIGMTADIEPCGNPATIGGEITEADLGINYQWGPYSTGDSGEEPIPGLSVGIPIVGNAQVEAAYDIEGNAGALTIKLGLDACIDSIIGKECGSDLTSELPIYILQDTFHFDSICGGGDGDVRRADASGFS